ncbi:hypothetical protein HNR23_001895 [Nocardiopsis mwathae]|uniref:Uncharacterized protein n=1 Tax=Nocardiopsis mwathae TaxID=1472723 RepID=A0A7W9YGQ4_9ACTN|nr:hypothetical protein [Nocardiopsis mwathae]MBB6171835.1 hypothetical protein [Nocardiopsis mwathae]
MPSFEHEFSLDLIRHAPDLAVRLYERVSGADVPDYAWARCESGDATKSSPPELRADSVVLLESPPAAGEEKPVRVQGIIVEPQNGYDRRKRFSWPTYVANLRSRLECPVVLIVFTPTDALAKWSAQPIDCGGGYMVQRPLAVSLEALQPVRDPEKATECPELAVLAAVLHETEDKEVLDALIPALAAIDESTSTLYSDYVLQALPTAARMYLEDTMATGTYEFKTEFIGRPYRQGKADGEVEGKAGDVLMILETRGLSVPDAVRERVTSCDDVEQLNTLVRRAVTVDRAEDLFASPWSGASA